MIPLFPKLWSREFLTWPMVPAYPGVLVSWCPGSPGSPGSPGPEKAIYQKKDKNKVNCFALKKFQILKHDVVQFSHVFLVEGGQASILCSSLKCFVGRRPFRFVVL